MNVTILPPNLPWHAKVELTEQQWANIDNPFLEDGWLDRPIRTWVNQHCDHSTNFTYYGHILFAHEDDLIKFLLTWS